MGNFRKVAISIGTAVLFGLIIISFLFVGNGTGNLSNLAALGGGTAVIEAGQRKLSPEQWKSAFDRTLEGMSQQYQQQITEQQAIDNHLDEQILPSAAATEAKMEVIRQMGIKAGPQMIADQLRTQPAFFNPVTGKFDRKAYLSTLASNNLDPKTFEAGLSDQLAAQSFDFGEAAGVKAPRAYSAILGVMNKQVRTASYVTLDKSQVPAIAKPTDEQLKAIIAENNYRLPELRQLSVVRFSAKAIAPTMPVDEALIQKQFDFRKDAESKPESRSLIQITTKDQATAETAAARVTKGEDPQQVAKAIGGQAIVYDDKPKTGVPDPKVATVAFSMTVGQVSGAIKGDLGYSVVKVTGISPGKTADLATMRPELEKQAKQQAAEKKVTEDANKFETVHGTGADIAKSAAAVGATVTTTAPIVAQGVDPDTNKPADGVSQKMLQIAFKQAAGSESDIESDGPGEYFVVRTDKIIPPALISLEKADVRTNVEKAYYARELQKALKTKAEAVVARLNKGETVDAVASSSGLKVEHIDAITRNDATQQGNPVMAKIGQEFATALFNGKKGDVIQGAGPQVQDPKAPSNPTVFIGRVDAITTGDVAQAAQLAADAQASTTQSMTGELGQSVTLAAKTAINPKIYPDRAKRALGVDPAATAKPKGKAG
jgi:peptidyl-prolyl cis-trans isomerase D